MMPTKYVVLVVTSLLGSQVALAKGAKPGGAQPATAAGDSKEAKERAAKRACLNGEPTEGIKVLTDLYVDTNDPTYIYNQGRCYEQNNLCEEAIVRFREYLRKTPNRDASDRAEVAKHIADCETLLANKGGGVTAPPSVAMPPTVAAAPVTAPIAAPPAAVAVTPSDQTVVASPETGARPGAGLRTAGVLTMAAGAALVVGGLVLNLQHNSKMTSLQSDYSSEGVDSAQQYKTLSMVGYGAGAAGLVGGAVLYWLGRREGSTVVVPAAVAGNAGLRLGGSF
jgi:hypothetical protein